MSKPNILIFMSDQQRGDSIYPYNKAITPNVDKFCKEGLTFSKAHTIAPHCCPSRATFFSGLYPTEHGVWNNVDVGNTLSRGLYEDVRLFSEDLNEIGYKMAYSGKWHVSNVESPAHRGFDHEGFPFNQKDPKVRDHVRHIKPSTYEWADYVNYQEARSRDQAQIVRNGYETYTHYGEKENPFGDTTVVEDAIDLIKQRGKSEEPWCQFVGTLGPHDPYFVPQRFLDLYDIADIELPESFTDTMEDKPSLYRRTRDRFDQLSEDEHRESIRHYLAFCSYEDYLFGELLQSLEEADEVDNTLVLYTSDHGDYLAEHGLWCKGLPCFEGAYHIPAVMRWPEGIVNPDRVVDDFITIADFAPTFLELVGTDAQRKFTGKSLLPYIKDEENIVAQDAVFTQSNGNELYGIQRSVMTKEWKFVYNGYDYDELYDLVNDPNEMVNLIKDKKYDPVVKEMCKRLWSFAKETGDTSVNQYIMVALASYGPGVVFE